MLMLKIGFYNGLRLFVRGIRMVSRVRSVFDAIWFPASIALALLPIPVIAKIMAIASVIPTIIFSFIALKKKKQQWEAMCRLWSNFFQPYWIAMMGVLGLLCLVPTSVIGLWGLPVVQSLLPVTTLVLMIWFLASLAEACREPCGRHV
jgi:hypothetical protein